MIGYYVHHHGQRPSPPGPHGRAAPPGSGHRALVAASSGTVARSLGPAAARRRRHVVRRRGRHSRRPAALGSPPGCRPAWSDVGAVAVDRGPLPRGDRRGPVRRGVPARPSPRGSRRGADGAGSSYGRRAPPRLRVRDRPRRRVAARVDPPPPARSGPGTRRAVQRRRRRVAIRRRAAYRDPTPWATARRHPRGDRRRRLHRQRRRAGAGADARVGLDRAEQVAGDLAPGSLVSAADR